MASLTKDFDTKSNGLSNPVLDKPEFSSHPMEKMSYNIGQSVGTAVHQASEKTEQYLKSTRDYVEENPLRSVAYATLTGVALGSLLTLAIRRK